MNRLRVFLIALAVSIASPALAGTIVPKHEIIKTKNGAEIYYFPSEKIPLFQVELVFDGGSAVDPEQRSGLAALSMVMARRGILGMDENSISRKTDDLAAGIEFSAQDEDVSASAYGLNEHAPEVIDLMFRQLTGPTFPEAPFKRIKENHLDSLSQLSDSASALASHVFGTIIYNKTPYARPSTGLKADLERLTLKDAREYYPNLVRTDGLKALVIGGKNKSEVLDLVVKGIEAMPCDACGRPRVEPRKREYKKWNVPKGRVVVINRPGVAEAQVRMGFLGPPRKVAEYYDLAVAETILGGHFSSRLNDIIREKLNLTYGIGADFRFGWKLGTFVLSTSTQTVKTGRMLVEVNKLLKEFALNGPTEDELKMAKDYLTGSYPLSLQNLYAIAATYFNGRTNGLSPQFLDEYQKRVSAVSPDSLRAAMKKHFKLNDMVVVVVGDAKAIGAELTKNNIKYVVRRYQDYL